MDDPVATAPGSDTNIHVGIGTGQRNSTCNASPTSSTKKTLTWLVCRKSIVAFSARNESTRSSAVKADASWTTRVAFNLPYQGGQYGVAILSRFPIRVTEHRLYKNLREAERRGSIRAELRIDGRVVHFVTTHLDYQHERRPLVPEAQQDAGGPDRMKGSPLIVVGDFNDTPAGNKRLQTDAFISLPTHGTTRGPMMGFSYLPTNPRSESITFSRGDRRDKSTASVDG